MTTDTSVLMLLRYYQVSLGLGRRAEGLGVVFSGSMSSLGVWLRVELQTLETFENNAQRDLLPSI